MRPARAAGGLLWLPLLASAAAAALYQRPINQDCVASPGSAVNYFPQDYQVQGLAGNTDVVRDVVTVRPPCQLACAHTAQGTACPARALQLPAGR